MEPEASASEVTPQERRGGHRRIPPEERDLRYEATSEDLIALVGHEIRGPLTIMGNLAELLNSNWEDLTPERRSEVLRRISQGTRSLVNTIDSLVSLGEHGDGRVPVELERREADPLIRSMEEELAWLAYPNPLEIQIESRLPDVLVDEERLRQVMANLVVNAAKFSVGGSPIKIVVEHDRRADEGVAINVTDHGIGIPMKDRERVFEKFTKLGRDSSGLGLGLFVCQALVTSMQGHIWVGVGPAEDRGTTICVALKAAG